jgi:SSS family solute:Na+ symporter
MIIAAIVAPALVGFGQIFIFIQDFTGLISPGVVAIFLLGFFWKPTTASAALAAAIATIPSGLMIQNFLPEVPFLHRMGYVFLLLMALMVTVSLIDKKGRENVKAIEFSTDMFKTDSRFAVGALIVVGVLTGLYIAFWYEAKDLI